MLWCGRIRLLADFRLSRCILGLSVVPLRGDFLVSGSPKSLLRLKSFFGKPFVAASRRLIRLKNAMGQARSFVIFVGPWRTRITFFFNCVLAKLVWSCVRSWLQVSWNPSSFFDLRNLAKVLVGVTKRVFWVGLGALCWALWTIRNKFTIEHIFPSKPADVLFKSCILLQQWRSLTKEVDRDALDLLIDKIRASASHISRRDLVL